MRVAEALKIFREIHNTDPRKFLNTYYWSVLIQHKFCNGWEDNCPIEIKEWCTQQFDELDWVQIGRKIWFSNQSQYAHFWLTWDEYLDKD